MRESGPFTLVARRLASHGVPARRIERVTRELSDHWEDLRGEGLRAGLSRAEAEAQADARLGEPERLASGVIDGMQRASWLGRHPVFALCVLSFLLAPLFMAVMAFPLVLLDEWVHFTYWGASGERPNAYVITGTLWILHYTAMAMVPCWISLRAWNAGLGRKWVLAFCVWCALFALVRHFDADPVKRNVVISLSFPWRWNVQTLIVLMVHALACAGFLFAEKVVLKQTSHNTQPTKLL
jgi:hypothetical protein